MADFLRQFIAHNRMLEGGFVIDDRLVTLADIDVPILTVVGSVDTIGHPDSVRAIRRAAEPIVFQTNGPKLWLMLVRAVTSVLVQAFQAGALQGARAEEAFAVRCDTNTNPPAAVG